MEEIIIGKMKFVISNMTGLEGCNITLPAGVTTAFLSKETLEMLLEKIKNTKPRKSLYEQ